MGLFTDGKGRPELVVHPDIKLGRVTFRQVDDTEPEPEETPKQRARRELKMKLGAERQAREKLARETAETEKTGDSKT